MTSGTLRWLNGSTRRHRYSKNTTSDHSPGPPHMHRHTRMITYKYPHINTLWLKRQGSLTGSRSNHYHNRPIAPQHAI